ncbi:hypothetical protein IFM89_018628 [Coptis chinensis]|uniref:CCHC-type domain-containing protein n=1 Tax=Coptis chinensis TaxID=261450 RepID=A0A835LHQ6_9MAGN|nr:hypothetical protein IFM89_018628 [Coptis chinensis]
MPRNNNRHYYYLMLMGGSKVISLPGQQEKCFQCGQVGHLAAECHGSSNGKAIDETPIHKKKYHVWDTRQCTCCNSYDAHEEYISDMTYAADSLKLNFGNEDKSNNEMQLTFAACAIHLDNDISEYRRWFVPIVEGNHWWLYVFDPSARKVVILDSLASSASYIYRGMKSMKSMVTKMHFTLSVIGDEYAKKCGVKD